jgi:fatty-acyl-CoA synthase
LSKPLPFAHLWRYGQGLFLGGAILPIIEGVYNLLGNTVHLDLLIERIGNLMDQHISSSPINIGHWVKKWASLRPQKPAIIFENAIFTYQQLNSRVNQISNLFHEMGVRKGDRVAVLLYNSNVYIEVYFALAKLGAILVPLNFRLKGPELEFILKDSGSETLILGEEFVNVVTSIKSNIPVKEANYIGVGETIPSWVINYETAIESKSPQEPQVRGVIGWEDPHIIMYTSGTTGLPKGAILSHRKTFFNVLNADIFYGLTPHDVFMITRPLFHSGGLLVETTPMLYKGGTIILKKRFTPVEILETIEKYKVTVIEPPTTLLRFILEQCDVKKYNLSSVKCWFTGGERVPPSLLKDYQKLGISVSQIFGQTETSTITWLPISDASRKLGSVGIPVLHGNIKIVNAEGGEVKPGEVGEIVVSGPTLMSGYWGRPEATEETIRNGQLHTGDLAKVDEEGFFYIADRKKDVIISGGENIYPAEVEKVFLEHSNISDVAVVGIPDARWGEVGMAFIVLQEGERMTEEEALRFCEERMARFKIPKSVKFVKELPQTAAQKIMRYKLREAYLNQKNEKG